MGAAASLTARPRPLAIGPTRTALIAVTDWPRQAGAEE
jgi:hypothetical protein